MSFKAVAIFALSAVALARPQKHHHHHHGTGTGSGFTMPTGGPFSMDNSTNSTGFGAGSSSTSLTQLTMTVSPLPAASSTPSFTVPSAVAAVGGAGPDATPVDAAASSTTCTSLSTSTSTVTSIDYATVTVTGGDIDTAPTSATLGDVAAESSSINLSTSASVIAGAFFGKPTDGSGYSFGGSGSSSAPVSAASVMSLIPTSFMTSTTPAFTMGSGTGAASSAAASAWPSSSSAPSTGSSSGAKKGLSYNTASLTDAFAGKGISWAYNWAASPGGTIVSGAEYVPMLWGLKSVSGWASAAAAAISSGSSHVLSFNEPDLSTQSNMSPSDAATLHIANMGGFGASVQVGSPAVTNGAGSNPPMGTTWLQQFFTACGGSCKVDFVAFHYYSDTNLQNFQNHVNDVITTAANNGVSKVWLTEFGASGSDSDVASFLTQAITWLEQQPAVEKYAYFMCGDGTLLSGTSLSTIGAAYAA